MSRHAPSRVAGLSFTPVLSLLVALGAETYFAAGARGQSTWIVPQHDLVIVRMGHMRGQNAARRATNTALGLVMEALGVKQGEV